MATKEKQPAQPTWLKEYPFVSRYQRLSGGHQLHYIDERPPVPDLDHSDAELDPSPVVFIHGNPTWSYYFRKPIQRLRQAHRCLALDHIGMGLSDRPQSHRVNPDQGYQYTLKQRIKDLDEWLSERTTEKVHLVMHDWGGMIGMSWAVKYPERIKSITLLNTAAFRIPITKSMPWQLKMSRGLGGEFLVRGLNGFCLYAVNRCVTRPLQRHVVDAYLKPYGNWHDRLAVYQFVRDIPLTKGHPTYRTVVETEEKLGRLKDKPIMVGFGLKDFVFDIHFMDEWKKHYPEAEYHAYPDAGHYILEDEGEGLSEKIAAHIRNAREDETN